MSQEVLHLNLARKWRSKQFDAVIGQELPVRILQNSLYLNQFFPVYLLSGQRGCGKTTTARLFAGAVNCENLELFQKQPKSYKIPCLSCVSCHAMSRGSHPDFIEIDAASHTGVDNIRNIIESASLLPVLGRKKIYLIDEAHMLSKAAFNAFLKILEEPPASVLFMLATTDPHKIIETVRSRCFQLFFTSIPTDIMVKHLHVICQEEAIPCDEAALHIIACETEGSARDALNLLEQVRFSHTRVSVEAVLKVLGHMPENLLLDLFDAMSQADFSRLMQLLSANSFDRYVPLAIWKKSTEVVRALLCIKQGLPDRGLFEDTQSLTLYAQRLSVTQLIEWLQYLYRYELLLIRSTVQHSVLEMLFIEMCQKNGSGSSTAQEVRKDFSSKKEMPLFSSPSSVSFSQTEARVAMPSSEVVSVQEASAQVQQVAPDARWEEFMVGVSEFSDPLLQSIFKQAQFKEYDESLARVMVLFAREATFFASWLEDTKGLWEGALQKCFGQGAVLKPIFESAKTDTVQQVRTPSGAAAVPAEQKAAPALKPAQSTSYNRDTNPTTPLTELRRTGRYKGGASSQKEIKKEQLVDISDTQKWQKAHLLKEVFGGSVVEAQGDETHDETGL